MPQWPIYGSKGVFSIEKLSLERGGQLMLSSICSQSHYFWSKTTPKEKNPKKSKKFKKKNCNFFLMFQMRGKNWHMIGCKHPNGNLFFSRFGLTSLYMVVLGHFLSPKKCNFWITDRNCFLNCRWLGRSEKKSIFGDPLKVLWSILGHCQATSCNALIW